MTSRNVSTRSLADSSSRRDSSLQQQSLSSSNFTSSSTVRSAGDGEDDDSTSRSRSSSRSYTGSSRSGSSSYTPSTSSSIATTTSSIATISQVYSNQKQQGSESRLFENGSSSTLYSSSRTASSSTYSDSSSATSSSSHTYTRSAAASRVVVVSAERGSRRASPAQNSTSHLSRVSRPAASARLSSYVFNDKPSMTSRAAVGSKRSSPQRTPTAANNNSIVQAHRISIPFVPDSQVVPIDLALKHLKEIFSDSAQRAKGAAANERTFTQAPSAVASARPSQQQTAAAAQLPSRQPSRLPSRQRSQAILQPIAQQQQLPSSARLPSRVASASQMNRLDYDAQQNRQNSTHRNVSNNDQHRQSRMTTQQQPPTSAGVGSTSRMVVQQQQNTRRPSNRASSVITRLRCVHCGAMVPADEPHSCFRAGNKSQQNVNVDAFVDDDDAVYEQPSRSMSPQQQNPPSNSRTISYDATRQPSRTTAASAASRMPQFTHRDTTSRTTAMPVGGDRRVSSRQQLIQQPAVSSSRRRRVTPHDDDDDQQQQCDTEEEYDEQFVTTDRGYHKHGTVVRRCITRAGGGDYNNNNNNGGHQRICNIADRQRRSKQHMSSPPLPTTQRHKRCDVFYNCAAAAASLSQCNENQQRHNPILSGISSCSSSSTTSLLLGGNQFYPSVMNLCSRVTRHLKRATSLMGQNNNASDAAVADRSAARQAKNPNACWCSSCQKRVSQRFLKPAAVSCCQTRRRLVSVPSVTTAHVQRQQVACCRSSSLQNNGVKFVRILVVVAGLAFLIFVAYDWLTTSADDGSDGSVMRKSNDASRPDYRGGSKTNYDDTLFKQLSSRSFIRDAVGAGSSRIGMAHQRHQLSPTSLFTYSRSTFQGLIK